MKSILHQLYSLFRLRPKKDVLLYRLYKMNSGSRFRTAAYGGLFLLLLLHASQSAYAQISYAAAGSNYTQNFNNLYGTVPANNTAQAATILPTAWEFIEAGSNANTTFRNDNGSSGTGDTYLNGPTSSNERSLGSYASGSLTSQFGASFTNNTGGTLTQFTLSYTGEQWKDGGSGTSVFNKLNFAYGLGATSLIAGTYVNVTGLDFTATVNNSSGDVTTDGNAAGFRTAITFTVTGINWAAGQKLYIRWTDINDAGNDDNLAVDDLTFSANTSATPVISTTGTLVNVGTIYGTASATPTSFNVSGANMGAGILVTPPAGYQVSLSAGSGYNSNITVGASGTITSTPVYVRLAATTAVGTYSGNIVLTSSGASTVNVATAASTVSAKALTITGVIANSKVFDGNTTATLSGTPALAGIVNGDTVALGGSPIANFASSSPGTGIAVSVTGFTISGSGALNYTLTQPALSADITNSPSPSITSALAASAVYGIAATNYIITASESPTSYNATNLPSGLTVDTATGAIAGTPAAAPGVYNVTISATNAGGTGSAVLAYTISAKPLTVAGAIADNKVYDRTSAASISGSTLVGVVNGDVVTITNTGSFANVNVGTAIAVTSMQALSGTDAAKYTLTVPTGLSADITPKTLTISSAAAQSKVYDGNTAATITGILSGVIPPDAVTLNLSGTFASSAIGNSIAVTSTSTITGANAGNYSLTQPTGLTASITPGPTVLGAGDVAIVGYNTNGSPDSFAILVLKDLYPGTVFYVNDNEIATAGGTSFPDLAELEASFTVKPGQTIAAGTVIVLPWGQGAVSTTTYDWSTTSGAGLGNNNEELYIYTASSITSTTPTAFIYYAKIGTSTSAIPAGLTLGTTAIAPSGTSLRYAPSGALYVGCPLALLQAIGNTSGNWTATGAIAIAAGDWSFTVEAGCRTISTSGTLTALSTTYGTASAATSFDVSGTSLNTAVTVTAPTGYEVSLTSGGTFTPSLTVGAAGTFGPITVYVRLSGSAAGTYSGNIVLTSSGAPTVTIATVASTVSPITITVSGAAAANKVYDRTVAATITGTPLGALPADGITLSGGGTFADASVGAAKAVTAALTLNGSNLSSYLLVQPTGLTADITTKALNISGASANNKEYDANSSAVLNGTLSGVIAPDDVTLIKNASFASANAGTGITVTSNSFLTGADIANYTLIQPTGLTADISPKAMTIEDVVAQNKVYDGNTIATITGTLAGVISPDDVTLNLSGTFASSAVGNGIAVTSTSTISGADIVNYTLVQPTGLTANITAAALTPQTITFNPLADAIYGDTVTLTATASSGLPVSYQSLNPAIATISGNVLTTVGVGIVTIKATQAGDSTYDTAPFVTQTLNVNPKELTANATASNKVYDGTDAAIITGTLNGIVGADAVTLNGTGAFADVNVGTAIDVNSTSTLTGANAGNYTLATITGLTADITPKALTIDEGSAVADNKVYDGTTAATITGGDLIGVFGSDEVYLLDTTGIFATANAGNGIAVTATLTLDGAQAGNYTLTQPMGLTADITKLPLTISGITGNNKVYNASPVAALSGTAVLNGVIGADDVLVTGSPTAVFANKNVGNLKPITVTGYTLTGTQSGNYSLVQPAGITANITPASLIINGPVAQNKVFDNTTAATITGTLTPIGTDVITLIGTGVFASSAIGTGIAVTSTATVGGTDGGNYIINPQPTGLTANITAGVQFTAGRLVVARTGATGQASAPTSAATATFLDEYSTTGAIGISVALPTTTIGAVNRILESGSATSEVQLNLSANGQYLVLGGYDAALGSASASGATNARVIARINNFGTVATLPIGATHTSGFRSATSVDGTRFWTAGNGNGVTTVPFTSSTTTAATPTVIYSGATNLRDVAVFNNQLYYSTGSGTNGIYKVGTGTPATGGQTATNVVTLADVYAYSMVNRGGSNWNLYAVVGNAIAANQGIYKYSSVDNGVTWTARGSIKPTAAPTFGVTAMVNGSSVDIYATTATSSVSTILKATDSAAFNADLIATASVLATAPANTFFRGIAFSPVDPISSSVLSGAATVCTGGSTNLNVTVTNGASPYTVVYNDGASNITITNYASGSAIPVSPMATTTYTLVSVTDAYGHIGTGTTGSATVTVNENITYYADSDGDTYGNLAVTASSCTGAPTGYVANSTDCNDGNANVYQSALLYIDADGDGYDAGQSTVCYGAAVPSGYSATTLGTDCNDADSTLTTNCTPSSSVVNIKMFIEGYYTGGGSMTSVALNQDYVSDAANVEVMTVELHDATTFGLVASATGMLHTDGTLSVSFSTAPSGSFYIAVKGSNILQTWTSDPQTVGAAPLAYDFTTSASQAYGDNMREIETGVFAVYSGDINQDEVTDNSDLDTLYPDIDNSNFGVLATDLNGDGVVDNSDLDNIFINIDNSRYSNHP